ncbi:MAG: lipopolysaccharide biosynthesis protein [Solirubrobacterales bacterium]
MVSQEHSVGTRTLRGMIWAYGSFAGGRTLTLVATAILARVLTPDEFGLVAIALSFMAVLEGIADLGLSHALVTQRDDVVEERAETVFVSSVGLGLLASLVIAAIGPLAASFFDQPELNVITPVLGLNFLIRSFGTTHFALAQRSLDFRARTFAEFSEVSFRGVLAISLAMAGLGAWSIVLGYLGGTLAFDVAIWILVRWRPKLQPRMSHLRDMIVFGGTISAVTLVAALIANVDYLFIGRSLGASDLGLYSLGFRLPDVLIISLSSVAAMVLFPAFAGMDRDALSRSFLISFRYTLLVAVPIAVMLAILARPIVLTLFGDKWIDSILPMRILAIHALAMAIGIPAGIAYKATGRAGILLIVGVASLILLLVALTLFVDRGIVAVAASQAAVASIASIAGLIIAARLFQVTPSQFFRAAGPALAGSALLALPVLAVERYVEAPTLTMIAGGLVGSVVYGMFLHLAMPEVPSFLKQKLLAGPLPEIGDPALEGREI